MTRWFEVSIIVLLVALLGVAGYAFYELFPQKSVPFVFDNLTLPPPLNYTSSSQFYPNMRFKDDRIPYSIESSCSEAKRASAREAFEHLAEETVLSFYETDYTEAEIRVICSKLPPDSERKHHFIAGEGGPTEILNGSYYAVIIEGTFSLYRDETCDTAHIALHETLHVLGFDHNNNPRSILYPTLDCDQRLDDYLISEINRLYREPSYPDLIIHSLEGNTSGRYLSFEIQISNNGLRDAGNVSLRVYADEKLIKEFALDAVPIASRKILTVTNLNVGRRTETIDFRVDESNTIQELKEENNNQPLTITRN